MSLFVIGEAPGPDECERGDPFVGRSGDWINPGLGGTRKYGPAADRMWAMFRKPTLCMGCSLEWKGRSFVPGSGDEKVMISNVRKCLHENETDEEKAASIPHCTRAYLEAELAKANPRAILLIGGDALTFVTGLKDGQRYHGSVWHRAEIDEIRRTLGATALPLPPNTHTVVFSLHPAFAMHAVIPQLKPSIQTAVARARRWSERSTGPTRDWTFNLEPTPDDLIAYLDSNEETSIDVETDTTNHKRILLVGVSNTPNTAVVAAWTPEVAQVMREFLARTDVLKIGHNYNGFDRHAFAAYGIETAEPIWDTMPAAALLNPPFKGAERMRLLNLAACVIRMIDGIPNWKNPEKPETQAWYRAAFPQVNPYMHPRLYCGVDVIATRLLKAAQAETLANLGML